MLRHVWVWLVVGTVVALVGGNVTAQNQPEGQLTIAFDTSIAPTYLDPAETTGIAAPFVFLYALHDALLKPLPGNLLAPCLAESWTESADGLVYEFKVREGLTFHNGDPFTAEDVKFSFLRSDPGVELVLEANQRYWRKTPSIKRVLFKGVPERPTRLAMLKTGEADLATFMIGDEGAAVQRVWASALTCASWSGRPSCPPGATRS